MEIQRSTILGVLYQLHLVRLQFRSGMRDSRYGRPDDVYLGLHADPWMTEPELQHARTLFPRGEPLDIPDHATWQYGYTILAAWQHLPDFPIPHTSADLQAGL